MLTSRKSMKKKGQKLHIKSNDKALKKGEMDYIVRQAILQNKYKDLTKTHLQKDTVWSFLEDTYSKKLVLRDNTHNTMPRGVYYKWAALYKHDSNGRFTCIQSQVSHPW